MTKDIENLYLSGLSYSKIADALGMTKSNVAKLVTQYKMRIGEVMGDVDPETIKRRYIDDAAEITTIAAEVNVSVPQMKRYLVAHGISRDAGHMYRAGVKVQSRKGKRVPGSRRDPDTRARRGSREHLEKLAAAKRGKKGPLANRWKGGHEIGGYVQVGGGQNRRYLHREIAEALLGRSLLPNEQVHHIDRDRKNNDPSNLLALSSAAHTRLHAAMRRDENLDQRAWLFAHDIQFEDLQRYAEDRLQAAE